MSRLPSITHQWESPKESLLQPDLRRWRAKEQPWWPAVVFYKPTSLSWCTNGWATLHKQPSPSSWESVFGSNMLWLHESGDKDAPSWHQGTRRADPSCVASQQKVRWNTPQTHTLLDTHLLSQTVPLSDIFHCPSPRPSCWVSVRLGGKRKAAKETQCAQCRAQMFAEQLLLHCFDLELCPICTVQCIVDWSKIGRCQSSWALAAGEGAEVRCGGIASALSCNLDEAEV